LLTLGVWLLRNVHSKVSSVRSKRLAWCVGTTPHVRGMNRLERLYQMSKKSDLILWYAPDGSYGVCEKHELGMIRLQDITDEEHDLIDSAELGERELISVLDAIAFRLVNEGAKC
jgi:hypothetical protein